MQHKYGARRCTALTLPQLVQGVHVHTVSSEWWDVYLWYFRHRDSIFTRLHFYNWRASLHLRRVKYNVFRSFSQFTATLYWASSPVRLFSFNKMLWKIAAFPRLSVTSETWLWGTVAVWSCSRQSLINHILALIPFFFKKKKTFPNNMHFLNNFIKVVLSGGKMYSGLV